MLKDIEETVLPTCQTTDFIETVTSVSNLLTVVNSAANFLIYMLRGKKFRDLFLQTYFRRCIKRAHEPSFRTNGKTFTISVLRLMYTLFRNMPYKLYIQEM